MLFARYRVPEVCFAPADFHIRGWTLPVLICVLLSPAITARGLPWLVAICDGSC